MAFASVFFANGYCLTSTQEQLMTATYRFPCGCEWPLLEESPPEGVLPLLDFDAEIAPEDCQAAWSLLGRGETKGVFQLESQLGKQWTRKLKPETLEHITALGAILRPGSLKAVDKDGVSATEHYCRRKNEEEPTDSYHPAVDAILFPTYNVLVYQGQAMAIAQAVAGFSLQDADVLRKAIGKKLPEEMAKVKKMFLEGAEKAGVISKEQAEEIFGWIEKSQRYSFNKCASEDTIIVRPTRGPYLKADGYTVGHMYRVRNDLEYAKRHGSEQLHRKWKRLGNYGKGLSMGEDGRVRPNTIVDIQPAGVRPVFKVTTEDGKAVRLTDNHKVPTSRGVMTVKQVADFIRFWDDQRPLFMYARGEYEPTDFKKYKFSHMTNADRAEREGGSGAGVFGEANRCYTNGGYTAFKAAREAAEEKCAKCGRADGRLEMDHKDRDRTNNAADNLWVLCSSCHKKKEYAYGRTKRGEKGYPQVECRVVSVEPDGECETYDVTMEAPNHNFVVNDGLVVNNSHACCYGITGYESAYIKAHFPVAFFASWLYNARHKSDPQQEIFELVNDAKLFDVAVEPPDLFALQAHFHTDRKVVKFGLVDIKGVGEGQIDKLRAAVTAVEAKLGKPFREFTWLEFLVHFTTADGVAGGTVARLIEAGACRWPVPRRRQLAEFRAWDNLTATEQRWVTERAGEFADMAAALRALALPRKVKAAKPPRPRVPKDDKPATLAAFTELTARKKYLESLGEANKLRLADFEGKFAKADGWEEHLPQDERAELSRLRAAIIASDQAIDETDATLKKVTKLGPPVQVDEYAGPFGGCSTDARREAVRTAADLLDNPPSPLVDSPHWVAYVEEELLGINLSASKLDACNLSEVNCSLKEYLAGRTGFMLFGVEVQAARVVKTKKGKTPGSKMAFLTVADQSCTIDDAICFPDVWKEYGHLLTEGNLVILQGERDFKDKQSNTLLVKKVWQAESASTLTA